MTQSTPPPADSARQPVTNIVGVDEGSAAKLRRAGVFTVADMWAHAGDRAGRADLSGITGIDSARLADWAKKADLMRIDSIGPSTAALLEACGVPSLKQLRRRSAESLRANMEGTNRSSKIVDVVPSIDQINEWIDRAGVISG